MLRTRAARLARDALDADARAAARCDARAQGRRHVHARIGRAIGEQHGDDSARGRALAQLVRQRVDHASAGRAHIEALLAQLRVARAGARFRELGARLRDLLRARAREQLVERGLCGVALGARERERALALVHQLVRHRTRGVQLACPLRLAPRGGESVARAREPRARLSDLLAARAALRLREPRLRERGALSARLALRAQALGREPNHQRARFHALPLAHEDLRDRLVRFGHQLDAVALERADGDLVVAPARERGRRCRRHQQLP